MSYEEDVMEGPRGTRPEEYSQVLELVNAVFRGKGGSMEKDYPLLFNPDNLENMRIVLEEGVPIAHVGVSELVASAHGCRFRVGSIGSVCTHPRHRGRGIASRLLADEIERLRSGGIDVMLVSGGRGLYRRFGCTDALTVYEFEVDRSASAELGTLGVAVSPCRENDLSDLIEIYCGEPVRFDRSREEFRELLRPIIGGASGGYGAFVLKGKGGCQGYLIAQAGGALALPQMARMRSLPSILSWGRRSVVIEYAGDRETVAGSAGALLATTGAKGVGFSVPFYDDDMFSLFKKAGLKLRRVNLPGHTIKILNFVGLMEKFRAHFEKMLGRREADALRFSQDGEGFCFHLNEERFIVEDGEKLTKLIYGTALKGEVRMPERGRLADISKLIFPLPFPWPGLNYI